MSGAEHLTWEQTDQPAKADVLAIDAGLSEYNVREGRIDEERTFVSLGRDADGSVAAGVFAQTWGRRCRVAVLWVRDDLRRCGHGKMLMDVVETEAAARGCEVVELETLSFQAPDFYRGLGYEVVHHVSGFPRGIEKLYFEKRLDSA